MKRIKLILAGIASALAILSPAAQACTITPTSSGIFYGKGLLGQYCWVNPPQNGTVSGQCWGCTHHGGFFGGGTSCGYHAFTGTAEPTGAPSYGYIFKIDSDLGHTVVQCNGM